MPSSAKIVPLSRAGRSGFISLDRRCLHRFLVSYVTRRGLHASPELRALLIAAIDVYPGLFPARAAALEAHVDAVIGASHAQRMLAAATATSA